MRFRNQHLPSEPGERAEVKAELDGKYPVVVAAPPGDFGDAWPLVGSGTGGWAIITGKP